MSAHHSTARLGQSPQAAALAARPRALCAPASRVQRSALTAYTAFRERYYEPYLQYAALRIGRHGAAETVVASAFTELAVFWTAILGGAGSPAAGAWHILHDHVDRALECVPAASASRHGVQTLHDDARFLYEQMCLSRNRIAEVLGMHPADLPSLPPRSPYE